MSNKPRKHSELKKERRQQKESTAARLAGRWHSDPPQHRMLRPARYLIVTEGTKTEPNYFQSIKQRIEAKYGKGRIDLDIQPGGANTTSLFKKAVAIADQDINGGYDQVWIVYDKDDFPPEHFNQVQFDCDDRGEGRTSYRAAWSNEAFELWYVLHFEYMHSAISRARYCEKLSESLKQLGREKYAKNSDDMFELLEDRIDAAIARAKRLEENNKGKTPADSAPGTTVHKLIVELRPYL